MSLHAAESRSFRPPFAHRISRRAFLGVMLPGLLTACVAASSGATVTGSTLVEILDHTPTSRPPMTPASTATATTTPAPAPTEVPLVDAAPTPEPTPVAALPLCADSVPVIGIVAHHFYAHSPRIKMDGQIDAYRRAIAMAGGAPVLIPLELEEAQWRAIYTTLDGILLPGGVDVDPVHYQEAPHPRLGEVDPELDRAELMLARWALADDLPVLGICRGAQLLNVAGGGSLVQDIPSQWANALVHATSTVNAHVVTVRPEARLAHVLGVTKCMTNSRHHQAAKELGPDFIVTATASDGVIEAIERMGAAFCIGVQWHPENLVDHNPVMPRLFEAFVAAAAANSGRCLP